MRDHHHTQTVVRLPACPDRTRPQGRCRRSAPSIERPGRRRTARRLTPARAREAARPNRDGRIATASAHGAGEHRIGGGSNVFAPSPKLTALALAGTMAVAGASQAGADAAAKTTKRSGDRPARVGILERPDDRFDRAVVVARYRTAYARARNAGVAPKNNL